MILNPMPIFTDRFTYDSATRTFSAEASDFGHRNLFGRVWDDACDVGLTLISTRTNRKIVFAVVDEKRDNDGDLQYWILTPITHDDYRILIFND